MKKIFIDQKKNFANQHGFSYRSSGQFYFIFDTNRKITTTVSIFNYFRIKNSLEVSISISLRKSNGELVKRINAKFDDKSVINIDHLFLGIEDVFEGSLEVEFFCLDNLTIPYAAIIGIYETLNGISYVHTYSRNYSHHELEAGFTVTESKESNWTIRDSKEWESFAVLHNGPGKVGSQEMRLELTHEDGRIVTKNFSCQGLDPYETLVLKPSEVFSELSDWLSGGLANCSLQFKLNGAFTRSLVGNRSKDLSDMQVTHSNFAYNFHDSDLVNPGIGFNSFPKLDLISASINIYPDSMHGKYRICFGSYNQRYGCEIDYSSGSYLAKSVDSTQIANLRVEELKTHNLPSRFVVGYSGISNKGSALNVLPFEISLGIFTNQRPKKRFWWGPIGSSNFKNKICAGVVDDVYGVYGKEDVFIRIYNAHSDIYKEVLIDGHEFMESNFTYQLSDDDLKEVDQFGYYTFYSDYPGFFVFGITENASGSLAIEHGF